jgi:predicted CopG family antitoxin
MPRKNIKQYMQVQLSKKVVKKLQALKIHLRQSYSEVIEWLLQEKN